MRKTTSRPRHPSPARGEGVVAPVTGFLTRIRTLLLREQAQRWGMQGLAIAGVAALCFEVVMRIHPIDPWWPGLVGCVAVGAAVAGAGIVRTWPSLQEVARIADQRLGGRDRLVTALQFAGAAGVLIDRQRQDAIAFSRDANLGRFGRPSMPWPALAIATLTLAAAALLVVLPNPALSVLHQQQARAIAQQQAAQAVDQLASQAARGQTGGTAAQQRQLVKTLQQAAQGVRQASDPQSAVAQLSQAQQQIRSIADPNQGAKQDASGAAGQQLTQNAKTQSAGQAMVAHDNQGAATALQQLSKSVPQMSAGDRQQLAQALQQAAQAAQQGDPKLAQSLQKAASALQQGDTQGAQQALQAAAQEEQALAGEDQFQGNANQAISGLQQVKQPLAQQANQGQQGQQGQGQGQNGQGQQAQGQGQQAQGQSQQGQSQQGQGQTGQGASHSSGQGGGQGSSHQQAPGSSEKIYVPGQSQGSTGQGQPGQTGSSQPNQLVPYDQVLSQYQSVALDQVDRADIPEAQRQLVEQYFSNLGGQ